VIGRPHDPRRHVAVLALPEAVQDLDGHEPRPPIDPGDAGAVVADRGRDAGDVRAVAVVILRRDRARDEGGPGNQFRAQVRMVQVDARIQDGDGDGDRAGCDLPGLRRLDGHRAILLIPAGVVGRLQRVHPTRPIGKDHARRSPQPGEEVAGGGGRRAPDSHPEPGQFRRVNGERGPGPSQLGLARPVFCPGEHGLPRLSGGRRQRRGLG